MILTVEAVKMQVPFANFHERVFFACLLLMTR